VRIFHFFTLRRASALRVLSPAPYRFAVNQCRVHHAVGPSFERCVRPVFTATGEAETLS
jgi:hypothetical protein